MLTEPLRMLLKQEGYLYQYESDNLRKYLLSAGYIFWR
jgi:hypothetical protein